MHLYDSMRFVPGVKNAENFRGEKIIILYIINFDFLCSISTNI